MHGIGKAWMLAALLLASLSGAARAAVVSEGILGAESRIAGRFLTDDMDAVRKKFPQGPDRPLLVDIDDKSSLPAVVQLSEWLQAQRPVLDVEKPCVGPCAWLIAGTGRAINLRRGAVIAFDTTSELMIFDALRARIDAGEVFSDAALSEATRERFLERSKALRDAADTFHKRTQQIWPEPMLSFVQALSGPLTQARLVIKDDGFSATLKGTSARCLWWVPDAQGLRQIGIDVPRYQPPAPEAMAKLLGVSANQIYVGPMREDVPAEGLCPRP